VLVVEDHPKVALYVQRMIRQALHPREVVLLAASSAPDAIRLLAESNVDAVVSDYDLGDSTGAQVLDHVRTITDPPTFVFHSGSAEPHQIHDRVVEKGLPPAQLRAEIRRHLLEQDRGEDSEPGGRAPIPDPATDPSPRRELDHGADPDLLLVTRPAEPLDALRPAGSRGRLA
jgi:CheY-like chemotaxis protein